MRGDEKKRRENNNFMMTQRKKIEDDAFFFFLKGPRKKLPSTKKDTFNERFLKTFFLCVLHVCFIKNYSSYKFCCCSSVSRARTDNRSCNNNLY